MIECPALMKDLQGALSSTLHIYANLEHMRSSTFNKKVSVQSVHVMQRISNEIEILQSKVENSRTKNKKLLPALSQQVYKRSVTPLILRNQVKTNKSLMKKFIRASNSRLCSSRAGYTERKMEVEVEESQRRESEDASKTERKENRLEEMFGMLHKSDEGTDRRPGRDIIRIAKGESKHELLRKSVEALMKKMENPDSTIHRCIDSFHKVKEQQNLDFVKRVREKNSSSCSRLGRILYYRHKD